MADVIDFSTYLADKRVKHLIEDGSDEASAFVFTESDEGMSLFIDYSILSSTEVKYLVDNIFDAIEEIAKQEIKEQKNIDRDHKSFVKEALLTLRDWGYESPDNSFESTAALIFELLRGEMYKNKNVAFEPSERYNQCILSIKEAVEHTVQALKAENDSH